VLDVQICAEKQASHITTLLNRCSKENLVQISLSNMEDNENGEIATTDIIRTLLMCRLEVCAPAVVNRFCSVLLIDRADGRTEPLEWAHSDRELMTRRPAAAATLEGRPWRPNGPAPARPPLQGRHDGHVAHASFHCSTL
jgi:hypothetical protein